MRFLCAYGYAMSSGPTRLENKEIELPGIPTYEQVLELESRLFQEVNDLIGEPLYVKVMGISELADSPRPITSTTVRYLRPVK